MKAFYSDRFALPLPEGHRFPMAKYSLLRQQALAQGILNARQLVEPQAVTEEELTLVHTPVYVSSVLGGTLSPQAMRRIGFPWSPALVERSRRSVGGTLCAGRAALQDGVAVNLAGGTHHAFPDYGAGFCVFNDVAVAARALQREGAVRRVVVLDCDVHQGDGTAAIFLGDPAVFTFSIHGARNYPFRKQCSDLDIELEDGTEDAVYLQALQRGVERALELAHADLAFYLAGADPFVGDRLGRLALTKEGLATRDWIVLEMCRQRGVPVAVVMAGGYAHQIQDIVDIHLMTIRLATEFAGV